MNKIFVFLLLLSVSTVSVAQTYQYRVGFTDKNNTIYSLDNPEVFLSQASIDRRLNQHIAVDSLDFPVNRNYIDSVCVRGAVFFTSSKWLNSAVFRITDTSILSSVRNLPFVNQVVFLKKENSEIPPVYFPIRKLKPLKSKIKSVSTDYDYGYSLSRNQLINIDSLHMLGFDGKGMKITILDGGFYRADSTISFDSLWQTGRILGYKDFVNPESDFFTQNYHGTAVLSTMGSYQNGSLVGSSPQASFWLLRSEDVSSETWAEQDYWVAAAEYADSVGTWLLTSSLGYSRFDYPEQNYTWNDLNGTTAYVSKGASIAAQKGILVVNSVGNEGNKAWHYLCFPGDAQDALSVASVNSSGNASAFSGYGRPDSEYLKPDVTAQGEYVTVAVYTSYTSVNGTSFSTPTVCGAAACLWQAFPQADSRQIINAIKASGNRASHPDTIYGYGIPDFMKAYRILDSTFNYKPDTNSHDTTTYISVVDMEKEFCKVYPNPYTGIFTIVFSSSSSSPVVIELYNSAGNRVLKQREKSVLQGQQITIQDTSSQSKGVYILQIKNDKQKYVQKLIKD